MLCKDRAVRCDAHLSSALQDEKEEQERNIAEQLKVAHVTEEPGRKLYCFLKLYLHFNVSNPLHCVLGWHEENIRLHTFKFRMLYK